VSLELPLRTKRLALRRAGWDDVDDVLAYQQRPDVVKYLYRPPLTREAVRERVEKAAQAVFEKAGDDLSLVVERQDQPGVIGETVLKWASDGARQAEVGYVFNPAYGGNGYATEAALATMQVGFEQFGFHRIFARVDSENVASANVCRRLGMRQEAHLIESDVREADGVWGSELVFAMLDREWSERVTIG
jgi:RimJ/RimL family protein N-acetyltransferase